MKLSLTRESLHSGLGAVAATIPTKTTLPVLSNLLMQAKDGKLTIRGTDLDMTVSVTVDAEIEKEGAVTVPARKLAEITRELPEAPWNDHGTLFGGRDHSTVIHSVNKVEAAMVGDRELRARIQRLQDDLVR